MRAPPNSLTSALHHLRVHTPSPRSFALLKTTTPSSAKPVRIGSVQSDSDQGHLAFTKTSLYKLTLPLAGGHSNGSHVVKSSTPDIPETIGSHAKNEDTWEERVEKGERPVARSRPSTTDSFDKSSQSTPNVHSVVFLLHSGQPLSYVSSLIRAEEPDDGFPDQDTPSNDTSKSPARRSIRHTSDDPFDSPQITFHLQGDEGKRWSPSTGIGDFMREAARVSNFVVQVGQRRIVVNVPSFEDRTRFLRASLHMKTREIEKLARLKDECDRNARRITQRMAFGGAGLLGTWWLSVGFLTFHTDLGWDTMEPITYLTGLGTAISGYVWFLWHNREVSYRSVLTETTSKRQNKLYALRGLDIERYLELIEDAKELRKEIKRVADDYDLNWEQGHTEAGKESKRALQIVRKAESGEKRKDSEDDSDEDTESDIDNDADGHPDGRDKS